MMKRLIFIVIILIVAALIICRFINLNLDPPPYFISDGRGLLTDPYNVTYHARDAVAFNGAEMLQYPRWIAFKYSLASLASYISFSLLDVSRFSANLSAVILSTLGLLLFIWGQVKVSRASALIAAALLFPNLLLFIYSRFPMLENGLIFFSGLTYYTVMHHGDKKFTPYLMGLLIAQAAVMGKLFGIILIIPALLVYFADSENRRRAMPALIGSLTLFLIIVPLLLFRENIGFYFKYLAEQSMGIHGTPTVFKEPWEIIKSLMTFGIESRHFQFMPFLLTLLAISLTLYSLRGKGENKPGRQACLFNLVWLVAGYILLSIPNYRPLRYQIFLILPLVGFIATILADGVENAPTSSRSKWLKGFLLLAALYALFSGALAEILGWPDIRNLDTNVNFSGMIISGLVFKIIIAGLILSAVTFIIIWRFHLIRDWLYRNRTALIIILASGSFLYQTYWIATWFRFGTTQLYSTGERLESLIDTSAVVTGPYAQALTIDNNIKSFTYMFGMVNKEPNLFKRFPITHLLTDNSNLALARREYPELKNTVEVERFFVNYEDVILVRFSDSSLAAHGIDYRKSDFEKARDFFAGGKGDSLLFYLNRILDRDPHHKSGLMLLSDYLILNKNFDAACPVMDSLTVYYPDDYEIFFNCAYNYYKIYLLTGQIERKTKAMSLYNRSSEIYPYLEDKITASIAFLESRLKRP